MGLCQGRQNLKNQRMQTQSTNNNASGNQDAMFESKNFRREQNLNPSAFQNDFTCKEHPEVILEEKIENEALQSDQDKNNGVNQAQISLLNPRFQSGQDRNSDQPQKAQIETTQKENSPEKISNFPVNKYAHFMQSTFTLDPLKSKNQKTTIMDSIRVLDNGDLQKQKNDSPSEPSRNFTCQHCKKNIQFVMYIIPCHHQYHLECLLDRISGQIKNKELKIKCECGSRIHINFLRKIDIQNKLNLITEILNAQAEQLIIMNKDKLENYQQIQNIFNTQKSTQDYYYGNINCTQELVQTNITPGE